MENRNKIILMMIGDGGISTGFARVLHSIAENLPQEEYDIHHLAINYNGDPVKTTPNHKLYPAMAGGDLYGLNRISSLAQFIKPDVILILNDLWAIQEYFKRLSEEELNKTIVYFPVDAEKSDKEWTHSLERIYQPIAYTNFAKREIEKLNPLIDIKVIPHGIDTNKFYKMDYELARTRLKYLDKDAFIILNANRNQPRKRIDLTIRAFAEFSKDKSNTKLYLHMGIEDEGWHIERLALRYGIDDKLILSSRNISPRFGVSDETLNYIYNACDIGINTGMGEGWGLPNHEHAATGRAQVVTNWSALKEIYSDGRGFLIPVLDDPYTYTGTLTEGGVIDVTKAVEILNEIYENKSLREKVASSGYEYLTGTKFQWPEIVKEWDQLFKRVVNDTKHIVAQ